MDNIHIDKLNTVLIVLSLTLAYFLPFELFLFAYAVLGPLHYFTEINWIRDQKFFVKDRQWIVIISCFAFLITIPFVLKLPFFTDLGDQSFFRAVKDNSGRFLNSLFFLVLIMAIALTVVKSKRNRLLIIGLGIVMTFLLHQFPFYHILFGMLLPTVIHVYLFTILFMWYGYNKNKTNIGLANIVLMLLVPVLISLLNIDQGLYNFSDSIKNIFLESNFHVLNSNIYKILGLSDGSEFFFYEVVDLKVQMFIAFAYTYHYLNWFSKTTIIGWHKKLTTKRTVLITMLWIVSISLYFYKYKLGLSLLLFASLLHVFMELPLNVLTVKHLFKNLKS